MGVVALGSQFGSPKEHRVVGVGLDVFLEILRSLESLAAALASMWFQRNVDTNV